MFFIKWSNVTYQNISYISANNFYHEWMVLILLWCVRLYCVLEGSIIRSDVLDGSIIRSDVLDGSIIRSDVLDGSIIRSDVLDGSIIRSCRHPGDNSVLKFIFSVRKKKLFIFMLILSWGSPLSFFEHWKKCLNLEKKCPDCGHLWVKCLIEMIF